MKTIRLRGVVRRHLGRGAKLGYPTANIDVPPGTGEGVFFGQTAVGGGSWPSVIFVGAPETFGETDKRAEAHLLDFKGDLYGQEIELEIYQKHRDSRKFPDAEALRLQMHADEVSAREFFKNKK